MFSYCHGQSIDQGKLKFLSGHFPMSPNYKPHMVTAVQITAQRKKASPRDASVKVNG